jgi:O-antigen/teichoic acid export membrane protein
MRGIPAVTARLRRDTLWASATEGLTLLAQLVTFYGLSKSLGAREYGFYAGVQGIDAVLTTLFLTWTSMVVMQELVAGRRDPRSMTGSVLGWGIGCSVLALVAAALLGGVLVGELSLWVVLAYVAADAVGTALMAYAAGIVQVKLDYSASVPPRCLLVVGKMLVVIILWAAGSVTLESVAVGQLLVALAVGFAALWWAARRSGLAVSLRRPHPRDLRLGGLYAIGLGALSVQEDSDKTLLVTFGHPTAGGQYSASYRIVQLAFLPLRALLNASHRDFLTPDPTPGAHVRRAARATAPSVAYGLVVAVILLVAAPIPTWLLGPGYSSATGMIRLLSPLLFLRALSLFPINALLGLSRNGVRTCVLLVGAGVNVSINCVLIPRLSWIGAALGTIGSEIALAVAAWTALVLLQRVADRTGAEAEPVPPGPVEPREPMVAAR